MHFCLKVLSAAVLQVELHAVLPYSSNISVKLISEHLL